MVDFAPKARYGSAICSLDEKRAFVIGGRHTSEFYDDVWVLHNTERFSWSSVEVTSKVNPPPVAFATVNCANERVYLFGGFLFFLSLSLSFSLFLSLFSLFSLFSLYYYYFFFFFFFFSFFFPFFPFLPFPNLLFLF